MSRGDIVTIAITKCPFCDANALKTPFFAPEDEKERDRRHYECGTGFYFKGPDTVNPSNPPRTEDSWDQSECCRLREGMQLEDAVRRGA